MEALKMSGVPVLYYANSDPDKVPSSLARIAAAKAAAKKKKAVLPDQTDPAVRAKQQDAARELKEMIGWNNK